MTQRYWDRHSESCKYGLVRVETDLLIVSDGPEAAPARYADQALSWVESKRQCRLGRRTLGPTIGDIEKVFDLVRSAETSTLKVVACGGAKEMAAAVLGTAIAARTTVSRAGLRRWLRATSGTRNLFDPGAALRFRTPRTTVHLVPATLLAVQAAPSKTWIVNDPEEDSTYWGSHQQLVANCSYLIPELILQVFSSKPTILYSSLGVVSAVLIEIVAYGRPGKGVDQAHLALSNLIRLQSRFLEEVPREDEVLQELLDIALVSRECENIVGPPMPGLALTQAVSRVTARDTPEPTPGAVVAAAIIPVMFEELRPTERSLPSGWRELCARLHAKLNFPLVPSRLFRTASHLAAKQTLSRRAGADASIHESVLQKAFSS